MDIAIICTTVCVLVLCALVVWLSMVARAERRELYDRLQAGTLRDYIVSENERIIRNGIDSEQGEVPAPDPDMDYSYDANTFDEQTMIDLQQLEENFTAAMMAGDAAAKSEDV